MRFLNREEAGRQLASRLLKYKAEAPIVLGLPRGGVPVAYEVAQALEAPLDVWVVRKVGAPGFQEFGLGAVAEGGIVYLNPESLEEVGASSGEVREIVLKKSAEVAERVQRFRGGRPSPPIEGRTVIIVDDGIATGGTVRAALQSLRMGRPGKLVLAVPVAASQTLEELQRLADDVVCLFDTPALYAIGAWYEDFQQVPDEEVVRLLELARGGTSPEAPVQGPPG
ncbi:MAG: phosphoribosyltransferase [Myxococcaceae bacterium]|nr:phosphoribosyltransferase [Myxococcaceae bacterium]